MLRNQSTILSCEMVILFETELCNRSQIMLEICCPWGIQDYMLCCLQLPFIHPITSKTCVNLKLEGRWEEYKLQRKYLELMNEGPFESEWQQKIVQCQVLSMWHPSPYLHLKIDIFIGKCRFLSMWPFTICSSLMIQGNSWILPFLSSSVFHLYLVVVTYHVLVYATSFLLFRSIQHPFSLFLFDFFLLSTVWLFLINFISFKKIWPLLINILLYWLTWLMEWYNLDTWCHAQKGVWQNDEMKFCTSNELKLTCFWLIDDGLIGLGNLVRVIENRLCSVPVLTGFTRF